MSRQDDINVHGPSIYVRTPEQLPSGPSRVIFIWSHSVVYSRIREPLHLPISYQRGFGRVGPLQTRQNALATNFHARLDDSKQGANETDDQNGCQDPDPDPTCTISGEVKVEVDMADGAVFVMNIDDLL